jgi:hypothetical protein
MIIAATYATIEFSCTLKLSMIWLVAVKTEGFFLLSGLPFVNLGFSSFLSFEDFRHTWFSYLLL